MSYLLDKAHEIFDGRKSVKQEKTKVANLAKFFSVAEDKITDEFLLEEILKFKGNRIIQETNWKLEKDFEKRTWYEKNKELVEIYPEFVRSTVFADRLPHVVLNNLPKPADKNLIKKFDYTDDVIRWKSYNACDFGKKQRKHTGRNITSDKDITGYRSVSSGRYSSRCPYAKWDYYADYTCIFSADGRKVFYRLADGTQKVKSVTKNGLVKIENQIVKPKEKPEEIYVKAHHKMRIYGKYLPKISNLKLDWDRKNNVLMLVDGKEEFHFPSNTALRKDTKYFKDKLHEAVNALRKRRKEKIKEEVLRQRAARTFVSYDDSRNSGNCHDFTVYFAKNMWKKIGAEGECAVRADLILAERNDSYTKRAVQYAINRK